jgi:FkbM family methyltransferase
MRNPRAVSDSISEVPDQPWVGDYSPVTTADDLYFCFRLLLSRLPNEEEWPGHTAFIGEDLRGVVASYVNSLEFARRNLGVTATSAVELSKVHNFQIYTAADDLSVGPGIRNGSYEDDVTEVFRRFLNPGMSVVDVGANVGFFTMLAASLVGPEGWVMAVEPNPENMRLLEASRRANGFDQVNTALTAAGRKTGLLVLNTSFSNGTTSDPPDSIESTLTGQLVPCFRLDDIIPSDRAIDFIKMDAEGAEYNVVIGCQETITRCRPVIVSEFSPAMMPGISGVDGRTYLKLIADMGYTISVIEEDGSLLSCGSDIESVIEVQKDTSGDHVDIVALPMV